MCGITGLLAAPAKPEGELKQMARNMAGAITHRGPDDSGAWADAQAGIALGHRRLSIIDLSPAGHQPMASSGGRFVMAFNGEIKTSWNCVVCFVLLAMTAGARNEGILGHHEPAGRGDPWKSIGI